MPESSLILHISCPCPLQSHHRKVSVGHPGSQGLVVPLPGWKERKGRKRKADASQLRKEGEAPTDTGWLIAHNCEGKTFFKISFPNADMIPSVPCSVITAAVQQMFYHQHRLLRPLQAKSKEPTKAPRPDGLREEIPAAWAAPARDPASLPQVWLRAPPGGCQACLPSSLRYF